MAETKSERTVINWNSDNLDTYLYSKIFDINLDLMKLSYESMGIPMLKSDSIKKNKIIYDNEMVKENGLFASHVSSGAAIVASNRFNYGDFVIPDEILKYISEEHSLDRTNEKNLPSSEADFEKGREVFEMFQRIGFDDEASYALAGACWVESRWDCHAVNRDELLGKNPNPKMSPGWNDAGEGYFQITFWSTKYNVIHALNLPGVFGDKNNGYSAGSMHISDLDESEWEKISKFYLTDYHPKHYKALTGSDIVLQLCAAYLFKAAPGLEINFNNVKKRVEQTMGGHRNMYGVLYKPYNGFCFQILAAYVLSKYLSGRDINLDDIGIDFHAKSSPSFVTRVSRAIQKAKDVVNDVLNIGLFKKNPKGFNIMKACQWINSNAQAKSQHVCAKYVRMAMEAGGINTSGRPGWAWQYINYLPNIGFKFICKAKRNDPEYKPEPGDIAVYMKNGDRTVPGHICMWSGKEWCSDFKQKNMIVYSGTPEAYIFRFEG